MREPVPAVRYLRAGSTLRFGLGAVDGPRSTVWSVVGGKHHDDVYIGARDIMASAKLSLHQSGIWRRALTKQQAQRMCMAQDEDRVLNRWEVPEPIGPGWLHAVSISVPVSSVQVEPGPLKRLRSGETISFYTSQLETHTVRFDVLLKESGAGPLEGGPIHAQVGRIALPGGGCIWVSATEFTAVDGRAEADIEALRQRSLETVTAQVGPSGFEDYEKPVAAAWGFSNDNGRPTIIDLGNLRQFRNSPHQSST